MSSYTHEQITPLVYQRDRGSVIELSIIPMNRNALNVFPVVFGRNYQNENRYYHFLVAAGRPVRDVQSTGIALASFTDKMNIHGLLKIYLSNSGMV